MSRENVENSRGVRIALSPVTEGAGRRRSLDQRLFVRFPALYRLLANALMGLPRGSRLRRSMLARSVVQAYAAANRRDFDAVLVGWDPGSEFRPSADLMPPDRFLVTTQQKGHGSGSGVAVSEPVFQLFELRRGLVVRQEDFLDRSKALEAAGLRE